MSRKEFVLNLPFREITASDGYQPFANELQPVNHVDLSSLVDLNIENRHVFVYDLDGKILGFMTFLDKGDHFHLDLVEVNRLHDESGIVKPGFMLITLLENLSGQFGYSRITLHSTQNNIPYYQNLGYEVTGELMHHPDYGPLTPMEKSFN